MAIKGLREGLPVYGRAKIGEPNPAQAGKMAPPTKYDHIELTTTNRDEQGRLEVDVDLMQTLIQQGARTCGGCPRSKLILELTGLEEFEHGLPVELEIGLPFDDIELCFPNRLAYYRGRTVFCHGDMQSAQRATVLRSETKNGKTVQILGPMELWAWGESGDPTVAARPCGPGCPDFDGDPPRCKPAARLRFILQAQQSVGGCYEFRTTSWNSIANIQQSLEMVKRITGGTLAWIPLTFSVGYQTVQPRSGKPASKQLIARIGFKGGPQQLLETVHRQLAIRAPMLDEVRKLEATISRTWELSPEEVEEFRAEFDHDNDARDRAAGVEVEPAADAAPVVDVTEPESSGDGGGAESASGGAEEVHALVPEPAAPAAEEPTESSLSPAPGAEGAASAAVPPQSAPAARVDEHLYFDAEQREQLWDVTKKRATRLDMQPTELLRLVLKKFGVEATRDLKKVDVGRILTFAMNAKKA